MIASPPIGVAHFSAIDLDPFAFVELASRIGYAAVGLRLHPAFPGAPFYTLPAGGSEIVRLRRVLADSRVKVNDVEFVVIDPEFDPKALSPMLEAAGELNARSVSVCADDPDAGRLRDNLATLCDLADDFALRVDVEVMAWREISTIQKAAALVASVDRRNAGLLIDALHLHRSGGDPIDLRDIPPSALRHAQLCDAPATRPIDTDAIIAEARGGRLYPGEGDLPLDRMLSELPADVALSIEVPSAGRPAEEHLRRCFDATRAFLINRSDGKPAPTIQ